MSLKKSYPNENGNILYSWSRIEDTCLYIYTVLVYFASVFWRDMIKGNVSHWFIYILSESSMRQVLLYLMYNFYYPSFCAA